MSDFTRRPFLASQTDNAVISQPVIFGTEHINLDGEFDTIDAAVAASGSPSLSFTLDLETESTSLTVSTASPVSSLSLQEIVDLINDASVAVGPSATGPVIASAEEGVLAIRSENSGYVAPASSHAYIRVLPATTGFTDLAPLLGFAAHPHPAATVTAGDLASSSPRAMTQGNRPSSSFVARGEDRTSENFNRALHSLSKNLDNHQVKMVRGVAVPVVLEIPAEVETSPGVFDPNPRLDIDAATGEIKGVDLRTGVSTDGLDAVLGTDIFVDLPHDASLQDIAKYFAVLDSDWNEILHWDYDAATPRSRVVGVGTVAYAPTGPGSASTFDDDGNSVSPLPSALSFNSYRTALRTATTSVTHPYKVGDPNNSSPAYETITEIIDGSTIRCSTATFVTSQVEAGDIVVISNSSYSTPINHDGEYIVDVVVSETEIVVRPIDEDNLHLLNDAAGGNLVIRPNGLFEDNLYLGFEPRLPRMPAGGIKIVLGMKNEFGEVPRDFLLVPAVNSAEEVDAWVLKNLHQKLNFDGVYQGQGNDKGGGFHATVDGRPITLHMDKSTNSRSAVRSGSTSADEILAGNLLQVQSGDEFTLADVGRSIDLTIGSVEYVDWRVHRLLDGRTVELVPPPHQIDVDLPVAGSPNVSAWTLYDNFFPDFQAAISSVTESALAGGFHHTKVNDGTSSSDLSFAHFEHVTDTVTVDTGSAVTGIGTFTATFSGDELSGMANDPDNLASIFPVTHGSTSLRAANSHGAKTYVRILTTEHAGLYELYSLRPNTCVLRNLDGTPPLVSSTSVEASFLNLRMGVGVPVFGAASSGRAGLSVHQDGGTSSAVGIRAGWTGTGSGILVTANESNFSGQLGGHTSTGPAIEVVSFAPAYGARIEVTGNPSASTAAYRGQSGVHVIAETFAHDLNVGGSTAYRYLDGQWKAAGVLSYQTGKDSAGIFMRDQTSSGGPSNLTDTFPASLVVEDWGAGHVGAAAGQTLYGSLYSPGHEASGIYTGGSGTFNELRPGYTDLSNPPPVFWGDGAAWLGSPYLVAEVTSVTASAAADFAEFNFAHDYIVTIAQADIPTGISNRSLSELVHLGIGLDGGTYAGSVLAAKENGAGDILFALKKQTGTSRPAAGTYSLKCYGRRWFYSYIDIADYSEIGTGVIAPYQDTGSSQTAYGPGAASSFPIYMPAVDQSQDGAGGLRPLLTYDVGVSGGGGYGRIGISLPGSSSEYPIGSLFSLFSFGQRSGEGLADVGLAVSTVDARDRNGWIDLSSALTSSVDGHISIAGSAVGGGAPFVPGQLPSSPDALRYELFSELDTALTGNAHIELVDNDGVSTFGSLPVGSSNHFAGGGTKIVFARDRSAFVTGEGSVYLKMSQSILRDRLAFRVVVDALQWSSVSNNLSIDIVERTGLSTTVLATKTVSVAADTTFKRYVVDFFEWEPEQELERTGDMYIRFRMRVNALNRGYTTTPAHTFTADASTSVPEPGLWYLRGLSVHALENAYMKGNLTVQGILRSAGLRALTPIIGHQVVGPADVDLLQNQPTRNETGRRSRFTSISTGGQSFYMLTNATTDVPSSQGPQEGRSVGILPLFRINDNYNHTYDTWLNAKTTITNIEAGRFDNGHLGDYIHTSFTGSTGSSNPTSVPGVPGSVSVSGGYIDVFNSASTAYQYSSGTYDVRIYGNIMFGVSRTDIPGYSKITYVSGAPNGGEARICVLAKWAHAAFSGIYIFAENGTPGVSVGSGTTDILAVNNSAPTVVQYYEPTFDSGKFFRKGVNSAAINGYHPYFDPFFYWSFCALGSLDRDNDIRSDLLDGDYEGLDASFLTEKNSDGKLGSFIYDLDNDYQVNPDFWDEPGRTGFMVPLNPPHGSLLTKAEVYLSFSPADGREFDGSNEFATKSYDEFYSWGVWRSTPAKTARKSDWTSESGWRAREGCVVRIWRYNLTGEFGAQPSNSYTETHVLGSKHRAPQGYAELLQETEVDLSSLDAADYASLEYHHKVEIDISASSIARVVDRRRFTYFATVEFFIGTRGKETSSSELVIPGMDPRDSYFAKASNPYAWTEAFPGKLPRTMSQQHTVEFPVLWKGHLVRRYRGSADANVAVVYGDAFFSQRDIGSGDYSLGVDQWHKSVQTTHMVTMKRSLWNLEGMLDFYGSTSPMLVLPPATELGNTSYEIHNMTSAATLPSVDSQQLAELPLKMGRRPDSDPATPVVKFRGARLSWTTDRLSDGGW